MSEFDITKYEWSDDDVSDCRRTGSDIIIGLDIMDLRLTRDDAIAIAKYFNLTEEDIKL